MPVQTVRKTEGSDTETRIRTSPPPPSLRYHLYFFVRCIRYREEEVKKKDSELKVVCCIDEVSKDQKVSPIARIKFEHRVLRRVGEITILKGTLLSDTPNDAEDM